jgi:hypothetical protein
MSGRRCPPSVHEINVVIQVLEDVANQLKREATAAAGDDNAPNLRAIHMYDTLERYLEPIGQLSAFAHGPDANASQREAAPPLRAATARIQEARRALYEASALLSREP